MEIIIATHKEKCFFENEIFKPMQVGAMKSNFTISQNYYKDDSQDNISEKNPNYCELTAIYWAWKNLNNQDIIGLNHYRRSFNFLNYSIFKPHRIAEINSANYLIDKHNQNPLKVKNRVTNWLKKYDVILPYSRKIKVNKQYCSISDEYCKNHIESDWQTAINIIIKKYPEYEKSIENYLNSNNEIYLMNMFVAKREWIDNYCSWLFDILFEIEKNITISDDNYQKRVFGFLGERLLTLYVKHHKYKVKELPLIFIKDLF